MAKLYLKNAYEFENPSRRVFKEGGELFKGGSSQAKEIKDWTSEAEKTRELATNIEKQAEAIRNGANRDLLELYVDLFNSFTIPNQDSVGSDKPGEIKVKDHPEYKGKGLLEIVEKECGAMRMAFNNPSNGPDLRLLSYATVYNNFQKKFGVDANIIPFESSVVTVENGIVRVSFYDEKQKKTVTAESELFPWDSAKVAHAKLLEIQAAERSEEARRIEETGGPLEDTEPGEILDEPAVSPPPEEPAASAASVEAVDERSEYEKRLDTKVDAFRDDHGLTENGTRIGLQFMEGTGTYNATLKKPEGTLVTINVRAEVADKMDQAGLEKALEKALDEELARLNRVVGKKEKTPEAKAVPSESPIQDIRSVLEGQPVEKQIPFLNHEVDRLVTEVNKTYGGALLTKQGRERMGVLGAHIQEVNVWYTDLERTPPADRTALDAVKKKIEYLNSFPLFKPKTQDKDAPVAPAEPTSAAPDRKVLRQNAQVVADALELSTRLSPEIMSKESYNYILRAGVDVDQFLKQYVKGSFQYVTPIDRRWPEPNGDGSAEWSMDFRTAEGETFRVVAKTPALDLTKVSAFLEAQAALGNSKYKEADVIKYLGIRAISEEFKKSIDSTRRELKLDEKYGAYLRSHILESGPIESSLTIFPGLPNGDYVQISSLDLDEENPVSGKRTLTCMDGVVFQGELKDNVPSGTGGLWLKNGELVGPMEFIDGKAKVNHIDGTTKEVAWNRDSSSFEIKNI